MDIHKPKPIHNLREFLGEILVIVTGVLIALGLEQAVEAWHWHHQTENAEIALGKELTETVGQGDERIQISACVDRRLDELAVIVDAAAVSGKLPAVGDIGMPPVRSWSSGVWTSTLAGQTGEHMAVNRRGVFSVIYSGEAIVAATNARELDIWTNLYAMVGPGRALPPQEAADLRRAIGEARTANQNMGIGAVRIGEAVSIWRIALDERLRATFSLPLGEYSICHAIGPVPPHYGASPLADGIAKARKTPMGEGFASKTVAGTMHTP